MRYTLLYVWMIILSIQYVSAQSAYVPIGSYSMHMLDRMEIKQGRLATPFEFTTASKSYKRQSIALYADSFNTAGLNWSKQDQFNLEYLQNDNFEYSNALQTKTKKSLGGTGLYTYKAAAFAVNQPDFVLIANPVAHQKFEYDNNLRKMLWLNNKGLEIRGKIGNHFSYYTQVSDVQQHANTWDQQFYQTDSVLPGQSFIKTFDGGQTFDYWTTSGYAAWQAGKHFDIQFGHGRNFFGNGYRSLMMSDFSRDHLFLRVNTRVWRINYSNVWGQVYDYVKPGRSRLQGRHYFATTYANINITKRLNIGLFQTISFQRDSGYAHGGYDAQYLNPIIFYKPIENGLNSPDKTILGVDFKYNFARHFSAYGQLVISELIMTHVLKRDGWAGNKNAIQLGLKYIDVFGINNLDLQLEYNWIRPYMYTSFEPKNAYVNYNQNMAHPLGANLKDYIALVRYQPALKLFVTGKVLYTQYGNDTNGSNWGRNIRLNYYTYEQEYNNKVGQGVATQLLITEVVVSYMAWHNLFVDAQITFRKTTSDMSQFRSQTFNPAIALRWNIPYRGCHY